MLNLGHTQYFLGMKLFQMNGGIYLSQIKYAWDMFKSFKMETCKRCSTSLIMNLKISKHDGGKPYHLLELDR